MKNHFDRVILTREEKRSCSGRHNFYSTSAVQDWVVPAIPDTAAAQPNPHLRKISGVYHLIIVTFSYVAISY